MACLIPTERNIFSRLRLRNTSVGEIRHREDVISVIVAAGADAVRAMNGALVRLRKLPSCP